jgi:hypothetical protein
MPYTQTLQNMHLGNNKTPVFKCVKRCHYYSPPPPHHTRMRARTAYEELLTKPGMYSSHASNTVLVVLGNAINVTWMCCGSGIDHTRELNYTIILELCGTNSSACMSPLSKAKAVSAYRRGIVYPPVSSSKLLNGFRFNLISGVYGTSCGRV